MDVHRSLGPGLLESVYVRCARHEFTRRGIAFRSEVPIAIEYHGLRIDCAYRADLVVEDVLLLELKSVDAVLPIHRAQVLTYLKLSRLPQGILMNFNVKKLKDGIHNVLSDQERQHEGHEAYEG